MYSKWKSFLFFNNVHSYCMVVMYTQLLAMVYNLFLAIKFFFMQLKNRFLQDISMVFHPTVPWVCYSKQQMSGRLWHGLLIILGTLNGKKTTTHILLKGHWGTTQSWARHGAVWVLCRVSGGDKKGYSEWTRNRYVLPGANNRIQWIQLLWRRRKCEVGVVVLKDDRWGK